MQSAARLSLVLGLTLGAAPLRAADEDPAETARRLFTEGRSLAARDQYAQACPRFERSLELAAGIGTMFNLADCWEKTGHLVRAHALFLRVAEAAREKQQPEREAVAQDRARALKPKLPRLRVDVRASDVDIEIERDGVALGAEAFGEAIPVEPGTHAITAKSPGKKAWSAEVQVPDAPGVTSVTVPELEPGGETAPPVPAAPAPKSRRPLKPPPEPQPEPPPREASSSAVTRQRIALVLGGVGAGALVAGTALALQQKSSNDDARAVCPTGRDCTRDEIDAHAELVDDAESARLGSYVAFGLGTATLGAAALFYFGAREAAETGALRARTRVAVDGSWALSLDGSF